MQIPDQLDDIELKIPSALLDIRYASTNNFTGQQLYQLPKAWLRHEPLNKLAETNKNIEEAGLRLVIFDAFRPVGVQRKLRSFESNNNYVAEVSNHCRGITIDVTLANTNGQYLDMGTDYDDFTPKSHSASSLITQNQKSNRQLLKDFLSAVGFAQHTYEWWHFDYSPNQEWGLITDSVNIFRQP